MPSIFRWPLLGGILYSVLQWITILAQNSKRVWGLTSKWELAEFGAQTPVLKVSMSYKKGMLSHWAIFWGKKGVRQGVLGSEDPPRTESWCSDRPVKGAGPHPRDLVFQLKGNKVSVEQSQHLAHSLRDAPGSHLFPPLPVSFFAWALTGTG